MINEYRQADLSGPVGYADYGGRGLRVVFVHGLGGSHLNWAALAPLLRERARMLAPDLAGHGRTPLDGRSAAVHANQRLLHRFLTDVSGTPAILVGNSMGGMLSLLEAAANPDAVAGLVLVCPSLPQTRAVTLDAEVVRHFVTYALPGVGERHLARRRHRLGPAGLVAETLRMCVADPTRISQEYVDASVELTRERFGMPWADAAFLQAARSVVALLGRRRTYLAAMRAVTAPTLLIHGARDRLVPVTDARAIARMRPDWSLHVLDDVGHVPHIEVPDRVAGLILEWMEGAGVDAAATSAGGVERAAGA